MAKASNGSMLMDQPSKYSKNTLNPKTKADSLINILPTQKGLHLLVAAFSTSFQGFFTGIFETHVHSISC